MINIQKHINSKWQSLANSKIFLACSGGVDSMTLLHLFHHANFDLEVLHVNYQLRGKDSELDQNLIQETCLKLQIPFHLKRIHLQSILDIQGGNLQEIARNVRYEFFEEKRKLSQKNVIALGHHLDDQIETFFMHLARKSGIMGMACMPSEHHQFIRPLLPFSKEEIIDFAIKNNIQWREDISNKTNKYKRNILRNIILPELYTSIPSLKESVITIVKSFQETQLSLEERIQPIVQKFKNEFQISFQLFDAFKNEERIEFLRQLGQKSGLLEDLEQIRFSQKGKKIQLKINSNCPFSAIIREENYFQFVVIQENNINFKLQVKDIQTLPSIYSKNVLYLDKSKIKGELKLRKWQVADRMKIIGLNGSKRLSDIIKDAKIPSSEKKNILVVTDEKFILWCVGIRVSPIAIATNETKQLLKVVVKENIK
ncbi:MAG: tRNA lysidine(34) synthetase TilS [Flavobacteriia bacterium]|nr:tRNA lysidine(34) synthetase TilS [Flavobacteriia bacterium]